MWAVAAARHSNTDSPLALCLPLPICTRRSVPLSPSRFRLLLLLSRRPRAGGGAGRIRLGQPALDLLLRELQVDPHLVPPEGPGDEGGCAVGWGLVESVKEGKGVSERSHSAGGCAANWARVAAWREACVYPSTHTYIKTSHRRSRSTPTRGFPAPWPGWLVGWLIDWLVGWDRRTTESVGWLMTMEKTKQKLHKTKTNDGLGPVDDRTTTDESASPTLYDQSTGSIDRRPNDPATRPICRLSPAGRPAAPPARAWRPAPPACPASSRPWPCCGL